VVTLTWIHIYREPQLKKSSQGITEKKKTHRKRTKPEEAISREEAEENVRQESECHRPLQNQPVGVESKPATLRCFIHTSFLDAG